MALAHEDWRDAGPIPPELMDEPEEASEALAAIDAAFGFATESDVSLPEAIEMLADAEPERWRVRSDDEAEWAGRHLAEATGELEALRTKAHSWQERIQAWFEQAAREPARTAEFFGAHLEWYARRVRAEEGRKSVKLPSVKLSTRATPECAELLPGAEEALIEWALGTWDDGGTIAPPQPRRVYVGELRKLTSVVQVVDAARLVLASGEIVPWSRLGWVPAGPDEGELVHPASVGGERCPDVGDGWPSPEEAADLVAQVEVLASHPEIQDSQGAAVPGVAVRPENVTVTVEPVL